MMYFLDDIYDRFGHTALFAGLFVAVFLLASPLAAQEQGASTTSQGESAGTSGTASPTSSPNDGQVSNVVQELSHELYSPFCPGKTIAMCPSGGAAKVRRNIQQMARDGMTKPEIKEAVLEKYGEEFRFKEPPTEDNIPMFAAIFAGLVFCLSAVWYLAHRSDDEENNDTSGPDGANLSDEDEMYLDEIRDDYME